MQTVFSRWGASVYVTILLQVGSPMWPTFLLWRSKKLIELTCNTIFIINFVLFHSEFIEAIDLHWASLLALGRFTHTSCRTCYTPTAAGCTLDTLHVYNYINISPGLSEIIVEIILPGPKYTNCCFITCDLSNESNTRLKCKIPNYKLDLAALNNNSTIAIEQRNQKP